MNELEVHDDEIELYPLPPALTKARALQCIKCKSSASPLFFGIEQISFEPPQVRAVAWCRGCVNLYDQTMQSQEYKVNK